MVIIYGENTLSAGPREHGGGELMTKRPLLVLISHVRANRGRPNEDSFHGMPLGSERITSTPQKNSTRYVGSLSSPTHLLLPSRYRYQPIALNGPVNSLRVALLKVQQTNHFLLLLNHLVCHLIVHPSWGLVLHAAVL